MIFCFWFFSWISFLQASDYTIRVVSNFCENSRRYSQLKVCHRCQRHRWQMEKTFKLKNFNNFVWTPLGSGVIIYINFCRRCSWSRWQFPTGVVDTGGKFAAGIVDTGVQNGVQICRRCRWYRGKFAPGVVDTGGNIAAGVVDTGGAPWLANISANFRKNSKRS